MVVESRHLSGRGRECDESFGQFSFQFLKCGRIPCDKSLCVWTTSRAPTLFDGNDLHFTLASRGERYAVKSIASRMGTESKYDAHLTRATSPRKECYDANEQINDEAPRIWSLLRFRKILLQAIDICAD